MHTRPAGTSGFTLLPNRIHAPPVIQTYLLKVIIQHHLIIGSDGIAVSDPASALLYQRAGNFPGHREAGGQRIIR